MCVHDVCALSLCCARAYALLQTRERREDARDAHSSSVASTQQRKSVRSLLPPLSSSFCLYAMHMRTAHRELGMHVDVCRQMRVFCAAPIWCCVPFLTAVYMHARSATETMGRTGQALMPVNLLSLMRSAQKREQVHLKTEVFPPSSLIISVAPYACTQQRKTNTSSALTGLVPMHAGTLIPITPA